MTTPLITNISPADGSVAAVGASSRFSVRDATLEINLSKLQLYRGTGPVFYTGGALPETLEGPPTFYFQALSGSPGVYADRTVLPDNFLRISKSIPSQNQEAVYFMGGLEAPAEPDGPLMAEFTLRLNKTEVTVDGNKFTGVLVGLLIGNTGLTVKFFTNAGVQSIQVQDAALTTTTPPSGAYISSFDWDEAVAKNADGSNTYKILWHPQRNIVKLFLKDPSQPTDQLLVSGHTALFSLVPAPEQRADQPWLFFGHGNYPTQTSISEWKNVFLQNIVAVPIFDGIVGSEHNTLLTTNNPNYYEGTVLPLDSHRAWQVLPASFGTIGGGARIIQDGLRLERSSNTQSIGYFRAEPKVTQKTVLDFRLFGEVVSQEPTIETSGIEVYIYDGIRQAKVALLQDVSGTQYVGLLKTLNPASITSYETFQMGWGIERNYRLVLNPGVDAKLYLLVSGSEGIEEELIATVPYTSLPALSMPGPGLGFLHNANSGGATARMTIRQVRYTTSSEVTDWKDFVSPSPTWTKMGTGTIVPATDSLDTEVGADASIVESLGVVTVSGLVNLSNASIGNYLEVLNGDNPGIYQISGVVDSTTAVIVNPAASGADSGNPLIQWKEIFDPTYSRMADASSSTNTLLRKVYSTGLQPDNGWSMELRARVVSYTHDPLLTQYPATGLNPVRAGTGFMAEVLDGTYRTALIFAEAGPPNGKIVILATHAYPWDDLFAIRSKRTLVAGAFCQVNWTKFHLYRFEKTIGGRIRLFIDEDLTPSIDVAHLGFPYPPHLGGGTPIVQIGHGDVGIVTVSDIQLLKFSISDGYDVSCSESLTEDELLGRFAHGVNVIVEAETL